MKTSRLRYAGRTFHTAAICVTFLLSFTAAHAQSGQETLCDANEKIWFEASYWDGAGAIAVCSRPDGNDEVGAIRVLNSGRSRKPEVLVEAHGAARAQRFAIRRYTRPQTTYLKFEFGDDEMALVIYDAYADGETSTSLRSTLIGDPKMSAELELKPDTETLSLMGLESVVQTLPFDE